MVTLAFSPPARPPPSPPAIYAPAPREVSFGDIRGRVAAGTMKVSIRVDGVYRGHATLSGRTFSRTLHLPSHDVSIRVISVDASGGRAYATVKPVYGLPRAAKPHAVKGSLDGVLQGRLRALVDAFPGVSAFYVQDLRTGKGAAWNARARFMGASTLKLGIAIEVLRVLKGKPAGSSEVGELFDNMLVYSDNAAANKLEEWLGGSTYAGSALVTATFRALGLYDSYINGGYIIGTVRGRPIPLGVVEQPPYYTTGKYTSAWDLARIHKLLHRAAGGHGRLLHLAGRFTASDARFLLWTLAHVRDPGKLDRYLDAPGISVLHKAGWISVARHDSGLVYFRKGAYVAVVMTYRPAGVGVSSDILAGKIAQTAFKRFSRSAGRRAAGSRLFLF
ncbi:MAG TPA: serine hydrolase [Gaiellaceae bacterium]